MRIIILHCLIFAGIGCLVNSQSTSTSAPDGVCDQSRLERLEKEQWELRQLVGKIRCTTSNNTVAMMSCQDILKFDNTSASGEYALLTKYGTHIEKAYCEMGLNGGGYTFLNAQSLADLTNDDIQAMFTDKSSLLMRVRKTDGIQRYAVLEQLSQYSLKDMVVHKDGLPAGYFAPVNSAEMYLGSQFIYFGFLPTSPPLDPVGVKVNKVDVTYDHCGDAMASLFAFFPNFRERTPFQNPWSDGRWPFLESIFNNTRLNPSFRGLPDAYYMFTEIHFVGCGVYTDSFGVYSQNEVTGIAMGFR